MRQLLTAFLVFTLLIGANSHGLMLCCGVEQSADTVEQAMPCHGDHHQTSPAMEKNDNPTEEANICCDCDECAQLSISTNISAFEQIIKRAAWHIGLDDSPVTFNNTIEDPPRIKT